LLAAMGARARTMLDAHFTRRRALDHWREVFDLGSGPIKVVADQLNG
jgi:hypothetical protein